MLRSRAVRPSKGRETNEVPKEGNQFSMWENSKSWLNGLILVAFLGNEKFLSAISIVTSANNFSSAKKKRTLNNFLLNRHTLLNVLNFLSHSLLWKITVTSEPRKDPPSVSFFDDLIFNCECIVPLNTSQFFYDWRSVCFFIASKLHLMKRVHSPASRPSG